MKAKAASETKTEGNGQLAIAKVYHPNDHSLAVKSGLGLVLAAAETWGLFEKPTSHDGLVFSGKSRWKNTNEWKDHDRH